MHGDKAGSAGAMVVNVDMLVFSTDVPPGMTHQQAARKAVVMACSDVFVKGFFLLFFFVPIVLARGEENQSAHNVCK